VSQVIAIVDDDAAVRRSLAEVLTTYGFTISEFKSGIEFLEKGSQVSPDCILLDIRMPGMDGLEVQKQLQRRNASIPIIFITGHGDIPLAVRAMREGAFDFVEKPVRDDVLTLSIEAALKSASRLQSASDEAAGVAERIGRLTPREREVMRLVVEGHSSTAIGAILGISSRTADHHRARILEKLEATSVANLIRIVIGQHHKISDPHDDA
jgi:two-component system, LuxR family, response regulator FixJ